MVVLFQNVFAFFRPQDTCIDGLDHLQSSFVFVGNAYAPAVWAYPVTDSRRANYGGLDPMHFISHGQNNDNSS
jgi:hypothetical protein